MKDTRLIMGMPVVVEIADTQATATDIEKIFDYFISIDEQFSPFKKTSELSKLNSGLLKRENISPAMQEVLRLSDETEKLSYGYFNITKSDGSIDTSGLVKGWAIYHAAKLLERAGFENYFVDVGGDIQVSGVNTDHQAWTVGIRDPFDKSVQRIVKAVTLANNEGIATSGTYVRGQHIYNPHNPAEREITDIVSLTVIGPNIYEADRFATAAFAMGKAGIIFIEKLPGFAGYMIDKEGIATMTSNFETYLTKK